MGGGVTVWGTISYHGRSNLLRIEGCINSNRAEETEERVPTSQKNKWCPLVVVNGQGKMPTQVACAYLKGHLTGRALDWFEVLGYRVVEDKATDYAHLKQALTEQFPVVRNRSELETRFYASSQKHNQKPSDFVYDLLKIHKISKLEMTEEKLLDHVITLWDTGAEKSFISEVVYRRYFSYRPRQKTKDKSSDGPGSPVFSLRSGRITDSDPRIPEKTWEFHILNNMQYQCILGIDFMKESKLTLDFNQKSLIISDDQIKQLPKVEKPVEIDLSDTKLGDGQKQKLKDLFNGFKGLFSDHPGLTHVLYHEIDTGDQGPVVSRPYRYDRVKQGIIDYHIEKILQEGRIRPIQSPYA
ncbi:uncharacterized protein TNCV_4754051 [Trichonephila clavipes]|nr:uncharacterized protein TNCV_4754051 [Trichonephila clavipes]